MRRISLERWPLTPNGKLDRQALAKLAGQKLTVSPSHVAARNLCEEQLAVIWKEVLGRSEVGVHDNFFELGGHSLLATQVISRLRQAFGVETPLRMLFESPTVAELAPQLDQMLVEKIDQLSEEEAARLLSEIPGAGRSMS